MKFCSHCGRKNEDGAARCRQCGVRFPRVPSAFEARLARILPPLLRSSQAAPRATTASLFQKTQKTLTWKRAIAWLSLQWLFVLILGHLVGLLSGHEILTKQFPFGLAWSVILSYWLLPCSFLHMVFGYTSATMPGWIHEFMFAYAAIIILLQGSFIRFRRWGLFFAALILLALGAAGCSSFAKTIHFSC